MAPTLRILIGLFILDYVLIQILIFLINSNSESLIAYQWMFTSYSSSFTNSPHSFMLKLVRFHIGFLALLHAPHMEF